MVRLQMFLAVLTISVSPRAQNTLNGESINYIDQKIDRYLISAVESDKFNGVALVAEKGKIIHHKAYGWRNFESRAHNDIKTIFPILSITKSFTAMVILKLQEQKKLDLKDRLSKYLPEFPNGDKISIEHLITHTSGIFNYTDDIDEEDSGLVNHPITRQFMLDYISGKPFNFMPGKGFAYNNSGYFLAGIIIEKVTNKTYEQNVKELIFDPLNMKHSGFDFNNLDKNVKATGYQFLTAGKQKIYTYLDSTVSYSAGSIYSTAADLYKWTQTIGRQQLLSQASWKLAFKVREHDYGMGFRVNTFFGKKLITHSGGYPGFVSAFVYYPKQDITIVLLKNSGNYGQDVWPVSMGISSILFGLPYDLWKRRTEIKLSDELLRQKEGKYAKGKLIISFLVKNSRLYEILQNGAELPLLAESENVFFLEDFNTQLTFSTSNNLDVDRVIIHEHGKDIELRKIK